MGIISINEKPQGRSGSLNFENERTYKRTLLVVTDNKYDGPATVMAGVGIPPYTPYVSWASGETDTFSRLTTIAAKCLDDGGKNWEVTLDYGKIDKEEAEEENPLDRPTEYSWDSAQFEEIFDRDVNGNAVVATNGVPFDPATTRSDSQPILRVTHNTATFPATAFNNKDTINANAFFGAGIGTVKFVSISATGPHFENDVTFYSVQYEFAFNPNGWKTIVLNQGLQELVGGQLKNILDDDGNPISSPVPLAENGSRLPVGGTPVYLEFEPYTSVNFDFDF